MFVSWIQYPNYSTLWITVGRNIRWRGIHLDVHDVHGPLRRALCLPRTHRGSIRESPFEHDLRVDGAGVGGRLLGADLPPSYECHCVLYSCSMGNNVRVHRYCIVDYSKTVYCTFRNSSISHESRRSGISNVCGSWIEDEKRLSSVIPSAFTVTGLL